MAGGRNSFKVQVRGDFNQLLTQLGSEIDQAIRPAAFAGANVLYKEMKGNAERIKKKTGNLSESIYIAYSPEESGEGRATYRVSWNAKKAPHGGLVEYGHLQRYVTYQRSDGKFVTKAKPGMKGKKKPSGRASQAAKDAYYVLLANPVQVAALPFARPVADKLDQASRAVEVALSERVLT